MVPLPTAIVPLGEVSSWVIALVVLPTSMLPSGTSCPTKLVIHWGVVPPLLTPSILSLVPIFSALKVVVVSAYNKSPTA